MASQLYGFPIFIFWKFELRILQESYLIDGFGLFEGHTALQ